jgi:hypothetical protein
MDRDLAPIVRCRAGYSTCDHPVSLDWQGSTLEITKIVREWREPGQKHFIVETSNGLHFKLVLIETSGQWLVSTVKIT